LFFVIDLLWQQKKKESKKKKKKKKKDNLGFRRIQDLES